MKFDLRKNGERMKQLAKPKRSVGRPRKLPVKQLVSVIIIIIIKSC